MLINKNNFFEVSATTVATSTAQVPEQQPSDEGPRSNGTCIFPLFRCSVIRK